MYFLTLDEMNLSRVENYAADFLSRFEKSRAGEKDALLSLYSRDIEQQLRLFAAKLNEAVDKDVKTLASTINHLSKYPSSIGIPEGLILFGTINLDETTHHLSPKFLDRSFVINIPAQNFVNQMLDMVNVNGKSGNFINLSLSMVKALAGRGENPPVNVQNIWNDIVRWQTNFIQPLGIWLGFRFPKVFDSFMRIAYNLGIAPRAAASLFFKSKLLPWISFHREDRAEGISGRTKLEVLDAWAHDNSLSNYPKEYGLQDSLLRVLERSSSSVIVQYLE
jgi:hypothetical protein